MWRSWTRAIDRLWQRARRDLGTDTSRAHFYVTGYGGLPAFVYLGVKLSKLARATLVRAPDSRSTDDRFALFPMLGVSPVGGGPYFERVAGLAGLPEQPIARRGKVVLFVSTGYRPNRDAIDRFADERGARVIDIVEAIGPGSWP